MSHHDLDPICNTSDNRHFQEVLTQSLENPARRGLLRGGLGLAGLAMLPGCPGFCLGRYEPARQRDRACGLPIHRVARHRRCPRLGFARVLQPWH